MMNTLLALLSILMFLDIIIVLLLVIILKEPEKSGFSKVLNKNRHHKADKEYYGILSENEWYFFTEKEIEIAKERAEKNKEDIILK